MNTAQKSIITAQDRAVLRDLARRVAEIAADPVMEKRRQRWSAHNSLQCKTPLMLIFPEGAWVELLPDTALVTEGARARAIERDLRQRIYTHEHFQDDTVVEGSWLEKPVITDTGWGVNIQRQPSSSARGAWGFVPVIKDRADLAHLHHPEVIYHEDETRKNLAQAHDLFGDILTVEGVGVQRISFHLWKICSDWCGLQNLMYLVIDQPDFVHEILAFIEAGYQKRLQQLIALNLLSLNNDNTYHSSGGNGYTDQLPADDFDPQRVRPIDMWGSAESQELQMVSPKMHAEFALRYEKRLLAHFGLNGYGCCEDLSRKLDDVFTIPNIRRISISPFADVARSAAQLKGGYIFSWKPQPAHLVGRFDAEAIRNYIRHTLEVSQEQGCVLEIILKDTHTVEFQSERFDRWTQIARDLIEEFSGE